MKHFTFSVIRTMAVTAAVVVMVGCTSFSGKVIDRNGYPVANATVESLKDSPSGYAPVVEDTTRTDAKGNFTVDGSDETQSLSAYAPSAGTGSIRNPSEDRRNVIQLTPPKR